MASMKCLQKWRTLTPDIAKQRQYEV